MEKIIRDCKREIESCCEITKRYLKQDIVAEVLHIKKYSHRKVKAHFRITNKDTGKFREYRAKVFYLGKYLIYVEVLSAFVEFQNNKQIN